MPGSEVPPKEDIVVVTYCSLFTEPLDHTAVGVPPPSRQHSHHLGYIIEGVTQPHTAVPYAPSLILQKKGNSPLMLDIVSWKDKGGFSVLLYTRRDPAGIQTHSVLNFASWDSNPLCLNFASWDSNPLCFELCQLGFSRSVLNFASWDSNPLCFGLCQLRFKPTLF